MLTIKKATLADATEVTRILQRGRARQVEQGNPQQWAADFPPAALVESDLKQGATYLVYAETGAGASEAVAVFSLFTDPDPTYAVIEGGEWLNDAPYATIHRIATTGEVPGVGRFALAWVQKRFDNVRIDTHEENTAMRHVLAQLDFQEVGTIYLADGDSRLAFHYAKDIEK